MYFHTDNIGDVSLLAGMLTAAVDTDRRVRINVDHEGNLTFKIGEGMWSAPIASTPDPYRDNQVKGIRWFVNEEGNVYDYPAEYQREMFPNDSHIPFETEEEAQYASDNFSREGLYLDDTPPGGECQSKPGCEAVSHYLNCPTI